MAKNLHHAMGGAGKSPALPKLKTVETGETYAVWLFEFADTSGDNARYVVWGNVYSTRNKALKAMRDQIKEDIKAGAIRRSNLVYRNGGLEVSDNDGRMYYKVSPRGIDHTR